MWLYVCVVLFVAILVLMIICICKKRHGLDLLLGVLLVLVLVAAIYCGVCTSRKYAVSGGSKLYSIPESNASITSELPAGNRVRILSQTQEWYQVRFGETEGWCHKAELFVIK